MGCIVDGCEAEVYVHTRQLCSLHYYRWHQHGDPYWQPPTRAERFWAKVEKSDGCWLYRGGITGAGYGIVSWREDGRIRNIGAHRFAYELEVGPIPDGLHLDHLCRTPACVNPAHLEPVTVRENTLRGVGPSARNAVATHCKHGHEFTPENTWTDPKRNARHCLACKRRRWHEAKARREEAS